MRRTGNRLWLAAALLVAGLWPGVAHAASTITGTVIFDGKTPNLRPLDMTAEPVCHKKHGGKPAPNEALVLGTGNTMANILVWVSKGLPAGKTWPTPTGMAWPRTGCHRPRWAAIPALAWRPWTRAWRRPGSPAGSARHCRTATRAT